LLPTLLLGAGVIWAGRGDSLPYKLAIEVARSEHSGPEEMRREVEFVLVQTIDERRCFDSADRWGGDAQAADLLLRIRLIDLEDETRYDVSQVTRDDPRSSVETSNLYTVYLTADLLVELLTLPGEAVVRSRQLRIAEAYRPVAHEDARSAVELQMIDEAVDATLQFVCKGSAKKLQREIDRARGR